MTATHESALHHARQAADARVALGEVLGLLDGTTPGPWRTEAKLNSHEDWEVAFCGGPSEGLDGKCIVVAEIQDYCTAAEDDAAFIAAARNWLTDHAPAILAELAEREGEIAELRVAFDQARGMLRTALSDLGKLMDRATAAERALAKDAREWVVVVGRAEQVHDRLIYVWAADNSFPEELDNQPVHVMFDAAIDAAGGGE